MAKNEHFQNIIAQQCEILDLLAIKLIRLYKFDLFTTGLKSVKTTENICLELDIFFDDLDQFVTSFEESITTESWNFGYFNYTRLRVLRLTSNAEDICDQIRCVTQI